MFKKNFKKEDIIKNISNKTGCSYNYSKKITEDFIQIIIQNIKSGNFNLKNIGSFKLIKKGKRIGRNPKTGKEYPISSRNSISFIAAKKIAEKMKKLT